jgi:hypothetical protein
MMYPVFRPDGLTQLDRLRQHAQRLRIGHSDHDVAAFAQQMEHVLGRVLEHDVEYYMLGLPTPRPVVLPPPPPEDPRDKRRVR